MNELLAKLKTLYAELRKRGDEALAGATPLDAADMQPPIQNALREFQWSMSRIKDLKEIYDEITDKLPEHVQAEIAAALSAKLEAGDVVSKGDVEVAIASAKTAKDAEKKTELEDLRANLTIGSERRSELVVVNAEAAGFVSDEDVLADDFEDRKTVFAARQEIIAAKGITSETAATAFEEYSSIPLDKDGSEVFASKIKSLEAVLAAHKPSSSAPPKGGSRPDLLNAGKGKTDAPPKGASDIKTVAFV